MEISPTLIWVNNHGNILVEEDLLDGRSKLQKLDSVTVFTTRIGLAETSSVLNWILFPIRDIIKPSMQARIFSAH